MKTYALIVAIVCFVFGLGMVLLPFEIVSLYGTQLNVSGQFMARYFGSALLGLAVMFLLARTARSQEELLRAVLTGAFTFGVSGLIVSIWDTIAGTHNAMVWMNVVIYAFFSIGFGFFYYQRLKVASKLNK